MSHSSVPMPPGAATGAAGSRQIGAYDRPLYGPSKNKEARQYGPVPPPTENTDWACSLRYKGGWQWLLCCMQLSVTPKSCEYTHRGGFNWVGSATSGAGIPTLPMIPP